MPRKPRSLEANCVYHAYNRRTDRQVLFPTPSDFDGFISLMEVAKAKYPVRHHAYCVMDTHWHMAVSGTDAELLTGYFQWLETTHAIRFRIRSGTRGHGHVYQDRFKSVVVTSDFHYLTLVRYIERNPLASRVVARAEHWPWSSLAERMCARRRLLDDGPVPLPADWVAIVNWQDLLPLPLVCVPTPMRAGTLTSEADATDTRGA